MATRKQIDARTRTLSPAAKKCRTIGMHAMEFVPVSPARRMELRQVGQYAERMVCLRGCSRWREQIFDATTDELIGQTGGYTDKDGYLMQAKGQGRLPRSAARAAYHATAGEPELPPAVPLPEAWALPARRVRPEPVSVPVEAVERAPRQRSRRGKTAAQTP